MRFPRRKSKSLEESERALKEAQKCLEEIQERGPKVTIVATSLRNIREVNHFIDELESIFARPKRLE